MVHNVSINCVKTLPFQKFILSQLVLRFIKGKLGQWDLKIFDNNSPRNTSINYNKWRVSTTTTTKQNANCPRRQLQWLWNSSWFIVIESCTLSPLPRPLHSVLSEVSDGMFPLPPLSPQSPPSPWDIPCPIPCRDPSDCTTKCTYSGGSRIFPRGGREPSRGGVNTPNFPENCMKSKEFGRPGGACVPHAPPRSANAYSASYFKINWEKTIPQFFRSRCGRKSMDGGLFVADGYVISVQFGVKVCSHWAISKSKAMSSFDVNRHSM